MPLRAVRARIREFVAAAAGRGNVPAVTPVPGADPAAVGPYLARVLDEPSWRDCTVEVIAGGRSNLTYAVTSAAGSLVLRRPPRRSPRR